MKKLIALLLAVTLLLSAAVSFADGEEEEEKPASKGVIFVQTNTQYGFLPLPAPGEDEYVYPLIQTLADGSTIENDIHVTPEGFYMEYSTCDNQNCVDEGEVTFENRDSRILGNAVLCLPNGVCLELYTIEEVMAMVQLAQAEEEAAAAEDGETPAA